MHNNAGKQENALAWQVDVRPLDSSALILQGYPGGERNHFECYSKRWVQFPGKRYEWMVCICTDIKMWVPVRKALCTLTHPGKHTEMQNYEKVFLLMQLASYVTVSGLCLYLIHQGKKGRGGHTGIHKHETLLRGEEMKGETRLLCHWVCWAQIILSICLCWTCIPLLHPHSPQ